jgi:GT2 family glycosyltransferase
VSSLAEISVIVVNWNGKHLLDDCLNALRRQTFRDFETIVVDNGSSDGSADYVRENFPEARLIALPDNCGFAEGNIAGYELATGQLIVLLNNDTEVHPGWLNEIHKASALFPGIGSFASKMMYFDERQRIENCGFALDSAGETIDLGRDELDNPNWQSYREVFGACGGAAAYRRCMLDDIGFLDRDFFMVYEDVDLSFRAQLRGYKCVFVPGAIVFHRYRSTLGRHPGRQVFYSQRNIEFVYFKNMPMGLILRYGLRRLLYELGAAMYFLAKGHAASAFHSKFEVIKHFRALWKKRSAIQRARTVSDAELRAGMKPGLGSKWKKFRSAFVNKPFARDWHLTGSGKTTV